MEQMVAGVAGGVTLRAQRPRAPDGRLRAATAEAEDEGLGATREGQGDADHDGEIEGGNEKRGGAGDDDDDVGVGVDVGEGVNRSGFLDNPLMNPFVLYEVGRPVTSWLLVYGLYDLASKNVPQWGLRTWPELYDSLNHYQVPH